MNKKQVKNYLEDSSDCPFCGSDLIVAIIPEEGDELEFIGDDEWKREVVCSSCGKSWREYYKLHDIEELDADGCAIENEAA